jgi:protein-S-isoprenylcysteine O-methyltransferase Ste14
MWITLFKLSQFLIISIFVVSISDFRKKTGMVPLINERITIFIKFSYFIPITIFAYTIATMDYLTLFDFMGSALTFVGTVVIVKAKLDLGICHTWAGYCKQSSKLEVSGIYAYIRHPLYLGVHLFSIGGLVILTFHARLYLTMVAVTMGFIMILFLTFTASKETDYLTKKLGNNFIRYRDQVHPFLPLKKYS